MNTTDTWNSERPMRIYRPVRVPCRPFRCLPSDLLSLQTPTFVHDADTPCRPPEEYIPPVPDPYRYIIFRASEVKDLAVETSPQSDPTHVNQDPAVVGVSFRPFTGPSSYYSRSNDDNTTDVKHLSPRAHKTVWRFSVAFLLTLPCVHPRMIWALMWLPTG
jgi:hypothetical protein